MLTRIPTTSRTTKRSRLGSVTLIEFAVCSLLLLTLTIGICQYGLMMNAVNTMTYITREAARYAAVHYGDSTFTGSATTSGSLKWYVQQIAAGTEIQPSDIVFPTGTPHNYYYRSDDNSTNLGSGYPITICLQYDLNKKDLTKGLVATGNVSSATAFYATANME